MRIVILTPALPHPFGDTTGRWYFALITQLAKRGHDVVAIAATEETGQRVSEARVWLQDFGSTIVFHVHPLQVDQLMLRRKWRNALRPGSDLLQDSSLVSLLEKELAKGYDVLHLEHMSTGWLGVGRPRTVLNVLYLDAIDWSANNKMSWRERKALWQAERSTRHLLRKISKIRVLTPRLKEMASRIYPQGDYCVVPLAIDPALYELQPFVEEPVVGMIGSLHWEPSRSAAERLITQIWPEVKRRIPAARLLIAGWNAEKYMAKYLSIPDVKVIQNLAHPVDFFSRTSVMVYAPSRGSGMKVKVMESMAYGVPVVTTWEGVEGLEYENGRDCCVEETDRSIVARVCDLLRNPAQRLRIRSAARKLIEKRYSPQIVVDQMMRLYEDLVSDRHCDDGVPKGMLA